MNMIDVAIEVAAKAHQNQFRKTTDTPYISHPYAVGLLLAQFGCSEKVIVAGILHDTVEDTEITLEYIQGNFGDKVASIVEGCSEPDKSLPWKVRKRHTIEFLKTASLEVRMVACADKLHNIRTIISEYEKIGNVIWERFNSGKNEQKWYYQQLVESLGNPLDCQLFQQFRNEVESLFGSKVSTRTLHMNHPKGKQTVH